MAARTATQVEPDQVPDFALHFGGLSATLDPAGAFWISETRTLLVSDLHLEKASSYCRQKTFLPPYDSRATLRALGGIIARRNPARVICLGDSFHDRWGPERLGDEGKRLAALQAGREWIWVRGNHDPEIPASVGGDVVDHMDLGPVRICHEPASSGAVNEISGHLHPSAKVRMRGRSVRRRAFVTDGHRLVLPAFGAFTGGLNVLDAAFRQVLNHGVLRVFMIGDRRVYPMRLSVLRPD